jgi:FixJ family two-component response regulator
MPTVLERPLREGDPVAVVDDIDRMARATALLVEDAGFQPVQIPPVHARVEDLLDQIAARSRATICDHRLGQRTAVPYDGAEVVARSNDHGIPAVLITTYANTDENTSIRRWRAGIPRLLRRGTQAHPDAIAKALRVAENEARGLYEVERTAYRTVVRVQDIRSWEGQSVAEVVVSAWHPDEVVELPTSLLLDTIDLQDQQLPGRRFMAEVNIYAETAGELYFRAFEPAPEVPSDWLAGPSKP